MPNSSYKGRQLTQPANTPSPLGLNTKRISTDEHVLLAKSWASRARDSSILERNMTSPTPTPTSLIAASPKTAKHQASKNPAMKQPTSKPIISYSQGGRKNNHIPVRDPATSSSEESETSNTDSESDDDRKPLSAVARPGTSSRTLINGNLNPAIKPYGFYALPHALSQHAYNLTFNESNRRDTGRNSLPPQNFPLVNLPSTSSESGKCESRSGRFSAPVNESNKMPLIATPIFSNGGRNSPSPEMQRARSESHRYNRSQSLTSPTTQLSHTQQVYAMQQNIVYKSPWYPPSQNGSFLTLTPPLAPSSSQAGSDNGRGENGSEFSFSSQRSSSFVSKPLVYIEGITPPEFRPPPPLPPHLTAPPPTIVTQITQMSQFSPDSQQPSRDALLEYMRFHQQMATQAYEAFQMQMQHQNQNLSQQSKKSDDKTAKLMAIPTSPPSKEKKKTATKKLMKKNKKTEVVVESPSSDNKSDSSSTSGSANVKTVSVNPYLNSQKLVIRVDSMSSLGSVSSGVRRDGLPPPSILRSASTGQQLPMKKKGVSFDATALVGDSERGPMKIKKHQQQDDKKDREKNRDEKKRKEKEDVGGEE
ncbi:hypothetical protein HK100_000666 [Physocladia obscura]|uniref:Uncharacterized protein n=1 Tax=Physocladia obscura TaxID=109957 RepID=A0AAD5SZL1_9FUNG|nr:hypothetical protein HK100_000666 [Physocladia obscura]